MENGENIYSEEIRKEIQKEHERREEGHISSPLYESQNSTPSQEFESSQRAYEQRLEDEREREENEAE